MRRRTPTLFSRTVGRWCERLENWRALKNCLSRRPSLESRTASLRDCVPKIVVVLLLTAPAHAAAWAAGSPGREVWSGEIVYFVRPPSRHAHVPADWLAQLTASWRGWQSSGCGALRIRYGGLTDIAPSVDGGAGDGVSVIGFEENSWSHGELVTALTRTRVRTGRIVEADLLLNAVHFEWRSHPISAPSRRLRELRYTLPHELGHFLGLGHSETQTALMYRDGLQVQPSRDDLDGLCALYGSASGGTPRSSSRQSWHGWLVALPLLAGLAWWIRRTLARSPQV
jgi:hypothetical protein